MTTYQYWGKLSPCSVLRARSSSRSSRSLSRRPDGVLVTYCEAVDLRTSGAGRTRPLRSVTTYSLPDLRRVWYRSLRSAVGEEGCEVLLELDRWLWTCEVVVVVVVELELRITAAGRECASLTVVWGWWMRPSYQRAEDESEERAHR